MFKQRRLEFLQPERWETLWNGFPESARREVTQQIARLMARTSVRRIRALQRKLGASDEPRER